ncbi:MAG: response regulator [Rhodospirillaceae bacterium]|jgi:CheY-like chemotaxis protein/HPt (histidine-containing phosphotransfer) domain-containing protein|nr:response regulator [Rhodospirillaceae bacterium]MBT3492975.1 response regulator [Rhodospirillaceae bacterium]MBT3780468.1 response regulator [Rhodospirillaceae bacterium]MBT3977252.1 response regulator [Rhodospirillaceae bacterium]MBT4167524.1 response regulator [Rhodospirillaceae bacterium]
MTDKSESAGTSSIEAAKDAVEQIGLPSLNILVVEDYPLNQEVISAMLGHLGHRIDIAEDGLEAVSAVLRFRYDMILMDIHMPKMDGNTAARRIRSLPRPEGDIPIIALTADASMEQQKQCLASGMNDYLTKPIILPELLQAMARCLAQGKTPDSGRGTQPAGANTKTDFAPGSEVGTISTPASDPKMDPDVVVKFAAMVGWETVTQLLETLEKDFPEHRKIITQAAEMGEIEVLRRQIQALNGVLSQFGATKVQETANVVETLCKADFGATAIDLIPQFLNLCSASIADLRQVVNAEAPDHGHGDTAAPLSM